MVAKVLFIVLVGPFGLNFGEARVQIERAKEAYGLEVGVTIQHRRILKFRDPTGKYSDLSNRFIRLRRLEHYAKQKGFRDRSEVKHFIVPPIIEEGSRLIGGVANGTCYKTKNQNPVSYSNGQVVNISFEPRLDMALTALEHELGHELGADHDDELPCTVMNSAAAACSKSQTLLFSAKSIDQIRSCLRT